MIVIINEQEDRKIIVYTDPSGGRARLDLGGKTEIKISATEYDAIRKSKAAAAALDGWAADKSIRVYATAAA